MTRSSSNESGYLLGDGQEALVHLLVHALRIKDRLTAQQAAISRVNVHAAFLSGLREIDPTVLEQIHVVISSCPSLRRVGLVLRRPLVEIFRSRLGPDAASTLERRLDDWDRFDTRINWGRVNPSRLDGMELSERFRSSDRVLDVAPELMRRLLSDNAGLRFAFTAEWTVVAAGKPSAPPVSVLVESAALLFHGYPELSWLGRVRRPQELARTRPDSADQAASAKFQRLAQAVIRPRLEQELAFHYLWHACLEDERFSMFTATLGVDLSGKAEPLPPEWLDRYEFGLSRDELFLQGRVTIADGCSALKDIPELHERFFELIAGWQSQTKIIGGRSVDDLLRSCARSPRFRLLLSEGMPAARDDARQALETHEEGWSLGDLDARRAALVLLGVALYDPPPDAWRRVASERAPRIVEPFVEALARSRLSSDDVRALLMSTLALRHAGFVIRDRVDAKLSIGFARYIWGLQGEHRSLFPQVGVMGNSFIGPEDLAEVDFNNMRDGPSRDRQQYLDRASVIADALVQHRPFLDALFLKLLDRASRVDSRLPLAALVSRASDGTELGRCLRNHPVLGDILPNVAALQDGRPNVSLLHSFERHQHFIGTYRNEQWTAVDNLVRFSRAVLRWDASESARPKLQERLVTIASSSPDLWQLARKGLAADVRLLNEVALPVLRGKRAHWDAGIELDKDLKNTCVAERVSHWSDHRDVGGSPSRFRFREFREASEAMFKLLVEVSAQNPQFWRDFLDAGRRTHAGGGLRGLEDWQLGVMFADPAASILLAPIANELGHRPVDELGAVHEAVHGVTMVTL